MTNGPTRKVCAMEETQRGVEGISWYLAFTVWQSSQKLRTQSRVIMECGLQIRTLFTRSVREQCDLIIKQRYRIVRQFSIIVRQVEVFNQQTDQRRSGEKAESESGVFNQQTVSQGIRRRGRVRSRAG